MLGVLAVAGATAGAITLALPTLPNLPHWCVVALAISGAISWLLKLGVQFGLPLQVPSIALDGLLAIAHGIAANPTSDIARDPAGAPSQQTGATLHPVVPVQVGPSTWPYGFDPNATPTGGGTP